MNVFSDLEKVYDANASSVGIMDKYGNVLLPMFHSKVTAHITVTISMDGMFLGAEVIPQKQAKKKKKKKGKEEETSVTENKEESSAENEEDENAVSESITIIPVTEDSDSRSSGISPHPLTDGLSYLAGDIEDFYSVKDNIADRYDAYKKQLQDWAESPYATPKVQAVYEYISKGSLTADLFFVGILEEIGEHDELNPHHELNPNQKIGSSDILKCNIRFKVDCDNAGEDYIPETWKDPEMFRSYEAYYMDIIEKTYPRDYCYVTGDYVPVTSKFTNRIRSSSDFAKLISANEKNMIVFRSGNFKNKSEVMNIGCITSIKAHNALKWLIKKYGMYSSKGDVRIGWYANGEPLKISYIADTRTALGQGVFNTKEEYFEAVDKWAKEKSEDSDGDPKGLIHFLELDSFTDDKGRISIRDYNTYTAKEYYESVLFWHKRYFWNMHFGSNHFTGAPSVRDIVLCAVGIEQNNGFGLETPTPAIFKVTHNRVIKSLLNRDPIPKDIVKKIITNASSPRRFKYSWDRILAVACAVVNGDERNGGEIMLDKEYNGRDYLFGRLLAIENYVERKTYDVVSDKNRETNAIRYMSDFVKRPVTTWEFLYKQFLYYCLKLNRIQIGAGEYYRGMVDDIMSRIDPEEFNDKPLDKEYLLGFSGQNTLFSKREYAKKKAGEEIEGIIEE